MLLILFAAVDADDAAIDMPDYAAFDTTLAAAMLPAPYA